MHYNEEAQLETEDLDETHPWPRVRPRSFRERHGLALLGAAMVGLTTLVFIAQVGC